jgi:hypothetical protein
MKNGHRNSEFSHEKWWNSIVMGQFTRGYLMAFIGLKQHVFWFKHFFANHVASQQTVPIYTYLYLIQTRKNMETYQAAHPWRIHSMLIDCSMWVAPLVYQPTSLTSTSMPPTTRISSCSSFMAGRALQILDLQQTWQILAGFFRHFPK